MGNEIYMLIPVVIVLFALGIAAWGKSGDWLQAAAATYRIALGPRTGQKVLTLRGAMPRETTSRQPLCADIDGNSAARRGAVGSTRPQAAGTAVPLHHAAGAVRRTGPTQRCRAGQVELKLKTPWRDGTTHLVMSPLCSLGRGTRAASRCMNRVIPDDKAEGAPPNRLGSCRLGAERQHGRQTQALQATIGRPSNQSRALLLGAFEFLCPWIVRRGNDL